LSRHRCRKPRAPAPLITTSTGPKGNWLRFASPAAPKANEVAKLATTETNGLQDLGTAAGSQKTGAEQMPSDLDQMLGIVGVATLKHLSAATSTESSGCLKSSAQLLPLFPN
jgi:hypothetical protein